MYYLAIFSVLVLMGYLIPDVISIIVEAVQERIRVNELIKTVLLTALVWSTLVLIFWAIV